jgi:hypothetical protein
MPSKTELLHELEWRRCRKDPFYFLSTYFSIRHPEHGKMILPMRDAQRETLQVWLKERLSIALKARQIGFSTLAAGLALWDVFFHSDRYDIMLSRTERDAQKLLAKAQYGYRWLPDWMKERGPKLLTAEAHMSKMVFDNESNIESLPASDPARGESAFRIIVDEWAFFPDPEAAFAAIEPAADIGGRIIALSTANGSGNLFERMWNDAVTKKSDWKNIFFGWWAADRDQAWYETKKRTMLEWQLHQEYPSSPEEAFIKSGRTYFDVDMLRAIEVESGTVGYLHDRPDVSARRAEFRPNADGPLEVWELPKPGAKYVIGADVAEGLDHGDYSVAQVINVETGRKVAKWRGHVDPDTFGASTLWYLAWFYNRAFVGIEVNNHGLTTCVALQNKGYTNIYYRHSYDEQRAKKSRKIGWNTNAKTKPFMLDELAAALRNGEVVDHDEETIGELVTYVRDENGKTHGSPFDDCVISLALAVQMLKHVWTHVEENEDEVPWGSWQWWEEQSRTTPSGEWLVGAQRA